MIEPRLLNDLTTDILEASLATILGAGLYMIFTHPKYQKKRLPKIRAGIFQVAPNLKIKLKNQTIHLHHWILLSAILGFLNHIAHGIDNLIFVKFFALGGIIQGFSFKDRFQVLIKKTNRKLYSYPKISVVIPAYNEETFIGKTLASLKKQDYPGHFEIIVVDNGSIDQTAKIAKKFGARVVFEPRKGVHFARGTGWQAAKSVLIASTDADTILPANWLSKLSRQLTSDPNLVATGGWFRLKSGPLLARIAINYLSQPAIYIYSLIFRKKLLLGQNFMVRKSAFTKSGGFEHSASVMEDLHLAQKLAKTGQVKMNYGPYWAVVSSPRRYTQGLAKGTLPYVLNAVWVALFGQVARAGFEDIRVETPPPPSFMTRFSYVVAAIILVITFLTVPVSPAHAKVAPAANRIRHSVTSSFSKGETYVKKHLHHHRSPAKAAFDFYT